MEHNMAWSAPVPHPDPLGTRLQFSPNICQHQDKSGHGTLASEPLRVEELLGLAIRAIDVYGATIGVEQPSQLRAVFDPFAHLGLELRQMVQRRHQLHHEIQAQVREFTLLASGQLVDTRTKNPGGIRRVRGPARKEVLYTGIEHQAASVFLRPISQLHRQLTVAPTGFSPRRGHDQDVAFRRAFDAQVRNGHAKPVILSVGHKALADLHGSDYPAYCPAKDTATGALASCVAISGNFSTNISRSESTNGATTIGRTEDAKGRTSMA